MKDLLECCKSVGYKKGKEYAVKVIKTENHLLKNPGNRCFIRFKNHDSNHVLLPGTFTFRNHLCMIMKLYETNLTKFLKKQECCCR